MKNALIFSPNFIGHRQIYAFVCATVLRKLGYFVYLAGNFSEKLKNNFYLNKLESDSFIFKVDTNLYKGSGLEISNKEFLELQKKYNITLTIFTEADNHIPLFNNQMFNRVDRFQGITIGIFLRPYYFYHKLNFMNRLRYFKSLKSRLKSDIRFFHEVSNPGFRLLSSSLYLDEYFVSRHKKTIWLPDVFQQFADKLVIEDQSEQRIWIEKLNKFKKANTDSFFLLYFGTTQQRRGYDSLLKLAVENNMCFIHCGLRTEKANFKYNVNDLRSILEKENRLFETNEYITDPICIEYFFNSVSHIILPYVSFYGSSGVMLQALSYTIPVLVPDIGIIGYRVKKHNLGLTYNSENFEEQFSTFIKMPKNTFSKSIKDYMKEQSADRLESILINAFKG